MTEIELINDRAIEVKINEFESLGGCIDIKVFSISRQLDDRQSHLLTAIQTLHEIEKNTDDYFIDIAEKLGTQRDIYYNVAFDIKKLENSQIKISSDEFLGPLFDFKSMRPIIRGRTANHLNDYFFYDCQENKNEIIDVSKLDFYHKYSSNGTSLGFTGAFLDPPHSLRAGNTILEKGQYFLSFCDFVFSDIKKIVVYKWSTDCSNYFDAGKEWWGSHFWTVYNPVKNWYIGIAASTTD